MRTFAISISLIIAVAIAAAISVGLGILIALACAVYQWILSYGRVSTKTKTVQGAYTLDIIRNGVFVISLGGALLAGSWYAVLATVVVFGVNLMMS